MAEPTAIHLQEMACRCQGLTDAEKIGALDAFGR
jgi:hypothetical protein